MSKYFLGIDLGTTNSVCCTLKSGKFNFIKFRNKDLLPSACLYREGKVIVGENARRRSVVYAENYIKSAKTYMGDYQQIWTIEDRSFSATDVAAEILREIKHEAIRHFGADEAVDELQAVITVPAYFTSNQIDETKRAGERAGFIVKHITTEPVAAAVAYSLQEESNKKLFVFDLGGGTFDVSIIKTNTGGTMDTLAIEGDQRLGGDDFDKVILEMFFTHVRRSAGVDLSNCESSGLTRQEYAQAVQKLVQEAEIKKIELSDSETVNSEILNLFANNNTNYTLNMTITRAEFEAECSALFRRIEQRVRNCFEQINLNPSDIDRVILVGGSSKIPRLREYIIKMFQKEPYADMDLSKLVAMGAALIADDQDGKIMSRDIIPHSLGVELVGEKYSRILIKNSVFPLSQSQIYTTSFDYQDRVAIDVYEGEDENDVANNQFYGGFVLDNIQQAKAGVPQIEVTFSFDRSRILHVIAKDLLTGSERSEEISVEKGVKSKNEVSVQSYDIVLLLDTSGSMSGAKLVQAKDACEQLINMLDFASTKLGFISFGSIAKTHIGLSQKQQDIIEKIRSVTDNGSTNMCGALREARKIYTHQQGRISLAILVTDGMPDDKETTNSVAKILKNENVRLITIGVGGSSEIDNSYLSQLASSCHDYHHVNDMSSLNNVFREIVHSLSTYSH